MTEQVSNGTILINHYRDALSHIRLVNKRDRLRYVGNKLEKYLIPGATLAGVASVALTFVYGIGSGLLVGTLLGLATAVLRYPNVLFGNGRYHAFKKRQYEAIKVYALTKTFDRIVSIQELLKHPSTKLTPEQRQNIQDITQKIVEELYAIEKRRNKRKKTDKFEKITKETEESSRNIKKLRKSNDHFLSERSPNIEEKYLNKLSLVNAIKDLEQLLGPVFKEHLSYLLDPNRDKIPYEENEKFEGTHKTPSGTTYVKPKGLPLYIPREEYENHQKKWDARVINGIQQHFDKLDDFSGGLLKIFQDLSKKLDQVPIDHLPDRPHATSKRSNNFLLPPHDPLTQIIRNEYTERTRFYRF